MSSVSDDIDLIVLRDTARYSEVPWACAGGLVYAKLHHPVIVRAFEIIEENYKTNFMASISFTLQALSFGLSCWFWGK